MRFQCSGLCEKMRALRKKIGLEIATPTKLTAELGQAAAAEFSEAVD